MARLKCPECDATLNLPKAPAPGKKVKCPRCEEVFTVPEEEADEAPRKKGPSKKENVKAPGKEKPAAKPAPKKPTHGDDEDEGGVYGLQMSAEEEQVEEEKKPKIEYAPDLTVKDPRGKATSALIAPSNWIILHGGELFFGGMFVFCVGIWPFIFGKYVVDPREAVKIVRREQKEEEAKRNRQQQGGGGQSQPAPKQEDEFVEEITPEEMLKSTDPVMKKAYNLWETMCEEKTTESIWIIVAGLVATIYGVVAAYGGVKMQNLESYPWAMTAAIMVLVAALGLGGTGIFYVCQWAFSDSDTAGGGGIKFAAINSTGVAVGITALTRLTKEHIKAAFYYDPEEEDRKKRQERA